MTNKNENSGCSGSYEVSGYTTGDGKKVGSYTRTCWKHGSGNGVQNTQDNIEKTNEKLDEILPGYKEVEELEKNMLKVIFK